MLYLGEGGSGGANRKDECLGHQLDRDRVVMDLCRLNRLK